MSAFAEAIEVLFADPNLAVDVDYRVGGQGAPVAVRAVVRQPDMIGTYGETRILSNTTLFDLRVVDLASEPQRGDTITWAERTYHVQGEATNDALMLIWTVEARAT